MLSVIIEFNRVVSFLMIVLRVERSDWRWGGMSMFPVEGSKVMRSMVRAGSDQSSIRYSHPRSQLALVVAIH